MGQAVIKCYSFCVIILGNASREQGGGIQPTDPFTTH